MSPSVYIIAGPNGAGKTTFAREFLPRYADCKIFINADLIAEGMSPFAPEAAAFRSGRMMLEEIDLMFRRRVDFGFEATLSGRSHLNLIRNFKNQGYAAHLFFLWVSSVDVALSRVRDRVSKGGHDVPEVVVRRRFERSIRNFMFHYRRLADSWTLFDNSATTHSVIAYEKQGELTIIKEDLYNSLVMRYGRK